MQAEKIKFKIFGNGIAGLTKYQDLGRVKRLQFKNGREGNGKTQEDSNVSLRDDQVDEDITQQMRTQRTSWRRRKHFVLTVSAMPEAHPGGDRQEAGEKQTHSSEK